MCVCVCVAWRNDGHDDAGDDDDDDDDDVGSLRAACILCAGQRCSGSEPTLPLPLEH